MKPQVKNFLAELLRIILALLSGGAAGMMAG